MGIKGLHQFLRKHCPDVYVVQPLAAYRYKKLIIDASLYMFKYKTAAGERWISCFVNLLAALRRNEIHASFCFDNGAPIEKTQEREARCLSRQKIKDRADELADALDQFDRTGEIAPCLVSLMEKAVSTKEKRLLGQGASKQDAFDRKTAENELRKLQSQSVHISADDFVLLKQLCSHMGVPIIEAPDEAEKKCVELCTGKMTYGVITEDTDVLAYGCPIFLTSIQYHKSECVELTIDDILDSLELSYESFRDFCIMCGTDYNKNIFKIGPEKAFVLIKQYGTIDMIGQETEIDISILNHDRVRELLTAIPDDTPVPFCKVPDFNRLDDFLFENNSKVDTTALKKAFEQHDLSFE